MVITCSELCSPKAPTEKSAAMREGESAEEEHVNGVHLTFQGGRQGTLLPEGDVAGGARVKISADMDKEEEGFGKREE